MDIAGSVREARSHAGLSQRELARRAGTSQPAVARYESGAAVPTLATLERLLHACGHDLDLEIRSTRAGQGSPPLGPRGERLRRHRRRLLALAKGHGAREVRIFGSVARGDETSESDVDILVQLAPGRTLLDLLAFGREASEILESPVDVATPDMLPDGAAHARAESVPL